MPKADPHPPRNRRVPTTALTRFSVLVSTCSGTLGSSGLGVARSLLIFPPNILNGLNPVFGSAWTGVMYSSDSARSKTALRGRDGLLVGRGRTGRTGILREVDGSEETPARNCSESSMWVCVIQ